MNKPNVNGIEIKVGDVWENRDGHRAKVEAIATTKPDSYPVKARALDSSQAEGGAYVTFTAGGLYRLNEKTHDLDLVTLISRAEPELPEDIADQFESHKEGQRILHVYGRNAAGFDQFFAICCNEAGGVYSVEFREGEKRSVRRKERWERGAFVPAERDDTAGIYHNGEDHRFNYERNTVTGEIREVGE